MNKFYRICPECDFFCSTNEEDRFCSVCGKKLIEHCPSCNEKITNPLAKYCKHCGSAYPNRKNVNSVSDTF